MVDNSEVQKDQAGETPLGVKLWNKGDGLNTIRILSGEDAYEKVRTERNSAREEYEKTGSRGALALVKSLDKVLETYERSRSIKYPQSD